MTRYVDPTEQLVLELSVSDLSRSLAFYTALGFDLLERRDRFAILAWEGSRLFLQEVAGMPPLPTVPHINLRVLVPDADEAWRRAERLGARVVVSLGDRYYGLRDFTIADPDGYEIRFATRLPTA